MENTDYNQLMTFGNALASMVSRILGNPSAVHCVAIHDSIWITENLYCVMVNSV